MFKTWNSRPEAMLGPVCRTRRLTQASLMLALSFAIGLLAPARASYAQTITGGVLYTDSMVLAPPFPSSIYALHATHRTNTRIAYDLNYLAYAPVYAIQVNAQAGDLLRLAGFLEVSERQGQRNKVYAYLAVRPAASQSSTRVSSYAWQIANYERNHHMPLNLFGRYQVPSHGDYIIEMMARETGASCVLVEDRCGRDAPQYGGKDDFACDRPLQYDCNQTSDRGHIIVEHYRAYSSVQSAVDAGARFLVDTDRAPFNRADQHILSPNGTYSALPATKTFNLAAGDILRLQSATTAELDGTPTLFALGLNIAGDVGERFSLATENLMYPLIRFTMQNDGVYEAQSSESVYAYQNVRPGQGDSLLIRGGSNTDVVAMHFAHASDGAYLAGSRELRATSDLTFEVSAPVLELFSLTDQHQAGDILRVQSQVQLDMISGKTGAACWARLEIYENGTRKYLSIYDQRFIRNSSDSNDDHDAGTFAPFALYKTQESGEHRVRLITDCNAIQAATMRAKYYGRHLTVDRFATP